MFKILLVTVLMIGATLSDVNITEHQSALHDVFKSICDKAGETSSDAALDKIKELGTKLADCMMKIIDPEVIMNEIGEAKPKGKLDEVFKKYCNKSPELKHCFDEFLMSDFPCAANISTTERTTAINAIHELLDFVCFKDGDRIAVFIAEQGPECILSKYGEIQKCFKKLDDSYPSIDEAKKNTKSEQCAKYDEMSTCLVKALEGCDTPTPANMAESLLRFIRKSSSCDKI